MPEYQLHIAAAMALLASWLVLANWGLCALSRLASRRRNLRYLPQGGAALLAALVIVVNARWLQPWWRPAAPALGAAAVPTAICRSPTLAPPRCIG